MEQDKPDYHCIECGVQADELYKDYRAGIIKISHCENCHKVVDKYIEYDEVIIFLDALLHKPQAYRHLLFNVIIKSPWKLLLIYLLCDTYFKWDNLSNGPSRKDQADHYFYAALEWNFYCMFLHSIAELAVFCLTLYAGIYVKLSSSRSNMRDKYRWGHIMKSIVVSSFGKLLAIPAIIWGQTHSAIYLLLTKIFIFTSNTTAVKVLYEFSRGEAVLIVAAAHCTQYLTAYYLLQYFYS